MNLWPGISFVRCLAAGLAFGLAGVVGLHGQARPSEGADVSKSWDVLEKCRLTKPELADGDSFHVLHNGREYVFRLYFVDAPEREAQFAERLGDQAAYFGAGTNAVLELGREAARFTTNRFTGDLTVITRWQNAGGRSSLVRFYAVVLADGKNHAAELVGAGLARIHGLKANWPDGPRSTRFISELKNLELAARGQKLGAWDTARFIREDQAKAAKARSAPPRPGAPLDLNEATFEELLRVPGVGKVLAERIVAHRPFRSVGELQKVRGIGAKTMFDKLKPHFGVAVVAKQPEPPATKPE